MVRQAKAQRNGPGSSAGRRLPLRRIRWGRALPLLPALLCIAAVSLTVSAADIVAEALIQPRIFNGVVTFDFPFAGLLLKRDGAHGPWRSRCTLTLVRPDAVLTAAHCVCDAHGSLCQPGERYAPVLERFRVLLQNAGLVEIQAAAIPWGFDFPDQDFAVLRLRTPVAGIAPAPLAQTLPAFATPGEIVGFGSTSAFGTERATKRVGQVMTAPCGYGLDDADFICWASDGGSTGANTCPGDSGAPLLTRDALGRTVVAGIASGGFGACDGDDLAFDTPVARHLDVIEGWLSDAASVAPADVARAQVLEGVLSSAAPRQLLSLEVPAGSTRLVAVGNGADGSDNDYVLRMAPGAPPSEHHGPCVSDQPGVFEACVLPDPAPGTWFVSLDYGAGLGGDVQLSATAYAPGCGLDVDADGRFDALTDGVLVLRHLGGLSGSLLSAGAIGAGAGRPEPAAIAAFLDSGACVSALDLDQDGERRAGTDGTLVLRYLFGFVGPALVEDAVSAQATRTGAGAITTALDALRR